MRGHGSQWISHKINIRHLGVRTVEKIKILGAVLELPSKQHCQSSPSTSKLGQIGQIGSAACGKFFWGVGGFLKILRNSQGGSWQMLTSAYKVGGCGKKKDKNMLTSYLNGPLLSVIFECVPISRNKALYVCGKSSFFIILIDA